MESLKKDTCGQWIALSGLVISIILISLAALASQAIIAGYHSSNAALEFPKEDIRELNSNTADSAKIIKNLSFDLNATNNQTIPVIYESLFNNYSAQIEGLYAAHGQTVDVSLVSVNSTNGTYGIHDIDLVFVNMTYNDGRVLYRANPAIFEVKT